MGKPRRRKVLPEGHDEVLHIVDDGLFDNPLINILFVTLPQLLNVHKVEEVLVLEHLYCLQSL
ncbi:hypothetical protein [Prevotella lacticifex]|uniref:hypothetical protein n=1 Tax=Prevotella lacticifex TaxID=2854755 RepID=UPI001CC71530|nr:hypothetical protein [Prevotella lacticifex]